MPIILSRPANGGGTPKGSNTSSGAAGVSSSARCSAPMFSGIAIQARISTLSAGVILRPQVRTSKRRSSRGSFTTSRCWVAMIVARRRALRVGVLPLRLEAPPRRRRRIDDVLQRVVVQPPPRLLVAVLGDRFVDHGEQRVGHAGR